MKASHVIQTGTRRWYVVHTWGHRGALLGRTADGHRVYISDGCVSVSVGSGTASGGRVWRFEDCPHTATDGWNDDGTPGPGAKWAQPVREPLNRKWLGGE